MNAIRSTGFTLLMGALASCTVYGQPQRYDNPPSSTSAYDQYGNQGYDQGYDQRYDQSYDRGDYGQGGPQVHVGFFYDELSPYGDWVRTPNYGWAWFPRNVHPYWRPYNDGRWVYTDYGWAWNSYEPFGWATYHYGRWTLDQRFGWLWIPGTVWGPAWVSWQNGGGYVGWAPLPPQVGFEIGVGLRLGGFSLSLGIRPSAYNFVPERSFLEPRLSGYLVPTARNVTIITNTTNITNYTFIDNRVVNRGIDTRYVERVTGRRVQSYRVSEANDRTRSQVSGEELRIYRPKQQQLESVRIGKRANAGIRDEPSQRGRDQDRASTQPREPQPLVVAPRVRSVPRPDTRQIDQQNRREREELARHQSSEKQKIEKAHQQENAKARAQSDRQQVEQRHQAERQALQQEQERSSKQLKARQDAKRQAVIETQPPPATKGDREKGKAVDSKKKGQQSEEKAADAKASGKNRQEKDGSGKGKKSDKRPPVGIR